MAQRSVSIRPQGSAPGVQRFRYRGASWHGLPGQVHVLHPDELHDGEPGTAAGFAYRMVYLDPALVGEALGSLPFAPTPLLDGAERSPWRFDAPLDALATHDLVLALAELLAGAAGRPPAVAAVAALDRLALGRVRACIGAAPEQPAPMEQLEALAGLDRWTLAREFCQAYGVSPSGYRVQHQVARAQGLMLAGLSLAAAAGFADQSHLTRQFRRVVGLTPARWRAAVGACRGGVNGSGLPGPG